MKKVTLLMKAFAAVILIATLATLSNCTTKPMPLGNGKFIQPTGKAFKLPMCTIGHWKDGIMVEEWLFWDSQTYMNQLSGK